MTTDEADSVALQSSLLTTFCAGSAANQRPWCVGFKVGEAEPFTITVADGKVAAHAGVDKDTMILAFPVKYNLNTWLNAEEVRATIEGNNCSIEELRHLMFLERFFCNIG